MSSKPASAISTTFSNSSLYNKESLNLLNSQTSKSSVSSSNDDNTSIDTSKNKNNNDKNSEKRKLSFNNSSRSISLNYDLLKIIENATLCANKSGYNVTVAIQDLDTPVYSYQSSLNSLSDDDTSIDIYQNKSYKIENNITDSNTNSNSNSRISSQISSQICSKINSKQTTSLSLESPLEYLYNNSSESNIYFPMFEYNFVSIYKPQNSLLRRTKSEIFNLDQKVQNNNKALTLRKQKSDSQLYNKNFMNYFNKTYKPHFYDHINNSVGGNNNSIIFPCFFLVQNLDSTNLSNNESITIEKNKPDITTPNIKNNKLINFITNTPSNTEVRTNTQNSMNINTIKHNSTPVVNFNGTNNIKKDNININNNSKLLSKSYSQIIHPLSPIETSLKSPSLPSLLPQYNGNKMAGRGVVDGYPQNSKLEEALYSERPSTSVPIVTHYDDIFNPSMIKSSFNIYEDMSLGSVNKNSSKSTKLDKVKNNLDSLSINNDSSKKGVIESSNIQGISNSINKSIKAKNIISLPDITINSNNRYERKNPFPKKITRENTHSFPDIYSHIPNDKIYKPQITIQCKGSAVEDDIDRYVNEDNQSFYCPPRENFMLSSKKMNRIEPQIYHKRRSSNQVNYDSKEILHDTNTIMKKIESEYSINDYSEDEDNIALDYFCQGPEYNELKPPTLKNYGYDSYQFISDHELSNPFQKEYIDDHNSNNYDDEYVFFYDEKDMPINKIKSFISTKSLKKEISLDKNLDLSLRKRKSYHQNEKNKIISPPLTQEMKSQNEITNSSANNTNVSIVDNNNNKNNANEEGNKKEKKNICELCHKKLRITATYKCNVIKYFVLHIGIVNVTIVHIIINNKAKKI